MGVLDILRARHAPPQMPGPPSGKQVPSLRDVTRAPCGVVLDLDMDSQVFVCVLCFRHRNILSIFRMRCLNVITQPSHLI
jgi:hypothetical protein